jgi:peroxiredoxin
MVATESTMLALGSKAPGFELTDAVSGKTMSLADFADAKALLVMFICNHCPFVIHVRDELAKLGRDYDTRSHATQASAPQDLAIVAISSNDIASYPQDAPDKMKAEAERAGYRFAYLFDESQAVAKAYKAACTPDFYLFDDQRALVYRGQLDDSRPSNGKPVTGADLRAAIDATLAGNAVAAEQKPSVGCNIKWKPGNAPDYFG